MYLPAYGQVAHDFGVSSATIALTLSSYFIGMALGQLFYGPFLDRYGRKKPLYAGLGLFILASLGCAFAPSIDMLIGLRFIQALGGCAAGVASLAMVHDFFPVERSAVILSRLFLFIAISPLLAPSVGGLIALTFGWKAVFLLLAFIVGAILVLIYFQLPESHTPDPDISLRPLPILREYIIIARHPRFATYAFSGAFSFAGLFTYVAGSPIIFMDGFQVSAHVYSAIFAFIAMGFIGTSQLNSMLLKRMSSEQLYLRLLIAQSIIGGFFMLGAYLGWYGLPAMLALFFFFLSCIGLTYPNAAALALSPFTKNAGSAASMLGFFQLGVGSVISTGISLSTSKDSFPIIAIMGATTMLGLAVLLIGRKRAHEVGTE